MFKKKKKTIERKVILLNLFNSIGEKEKQITFLAGLIKMYSVVRVEI